MPSCSSQNGITHHQFPRDPVRALSWKTKIGNSRVNLKTGKICAIHFDEWCYKRDLKAELLNIKRRKVLSEAAQPTLYLQNDAQPGVHHMQVGEAVPVQLRVLPRHNRDDIQPRVLPRQHLEDVQARVRPLQHLEDVQARVRPLQHLEDVEPSVLPLQHLEDVQPKVLPLQHLQDVQPSVLPLQHLEDVQPSVLPLQTLDSLQKLETVILKTKPCAQLDSTLVSASVKLYVKIRFFHRQNLMGK